LTDIFNSLPVLPLIALVYTMRRFFMFIFYVLLLNSLFGQQNPEGLFINSKAPDFRAKNQHNEDVRLKELLKKGKVVLMFYMGYWCPHCNRVLQRFQDSLQLILDNGAQLVAVTPEKPESIAKTIEKTGAGFPVLWDEGLKIMKAYDVAYALPENTLKRYSSTGLNMAEINGKNGNYLPVPAVYIINKESTIEYRFFETDYKKRPTVAEILRQL
jgi:peroxiredoxin